jgi:MFS family permease
VTVLFLNHAGHPVPGRSKRPLHEIKEGLNYVINSPVVGGLILLSIMPFMFGLSINSLLPAFSTDVLNGGPDDLGLLMTGMGAGAVFGSLALAKMGGFRNKGYWVIGTNATWGLLVALFAITTQFVTATLVIACIGFISAVNMSMNRSLIQLQVEQHMRGRIMSIDMMTHGLMPLGVLPIGYIAEKVSVSAGLMTSGLLLFVTTLGLGLLMPKIRELNVGY